MKIQVLLIAGAVAVFASCSQVSTQVPDRAAKAIQALNNNDLATMKTLVSVDASDKTLIDAGSYNLASLTTVGSNQFIYSATSWSVGTVSGSAVTATANGVSYVLKPTNAGSTAGTTSTTPSGDLKIDFINAGTLLADDWKVRRIYLPGNTTAVLKVPGFIQFTGDSH